MLPTPNVRVGEPITTPTLPTQQAARTPLREPPTIAFAGRQDESVRDLYDDEVAKPGKKESPTTPGPRRDRQLARQGRRAGPADPRRRPIVASSVALPMLAP